MKLGAAYNVFDGIELLEASIRSIRDNVDYICVVFQEISNYGRKLKSDYSFLESLEVEVYYFEPGLDIPASFNEVVKRNIGKDLCKNAGCTHFMTIDADEFYISEEFRKAKVIAEKYDSTACQMQTYYKSPEFVLDPPETYYVPFIYKLDNRYFGQTSFPVQADPTRKLRPGKIHLFPRKELQMHHLSYVRKDIRQKLENSSAKANWPNRIDYLVEYFEEWEYPKKALLAGSKDRFYEARRVKSPIAGLLSAQYTS
jgi:hypothetical protein